MYVDDDVCHVYGITEHTACVVVVLCMIYDTVLRNEIRVLTHVKFSSCRQRARILYWVLYRVYCVLYPGRVHIIIYIYIY